MSRKGCSSQVCKSTYHERTRRRKLFPHESRASSFEVKAPRERFRTVVFLTIIDSLIVKRRDIYKNLNTRFQIFIHLDEKSLKILFIKQKSQLKPTKNILMRTVSCRHINISKVEKLTKTLQIYS